MPGLVEGEEDILPPVANAPPPPRPAPPPPRPSQPPSRPTQPPSRQVKPPSRPAAPPSRPTQPPPRPGPPPKPALPMNGTLNAKDDNDVASNNAGFSDIFANITSPANEDLPISTSTGSLVDIVKTNASANIPRSNSNTSSSHSLSSLNIEDKNQNHCNEVQPRITNMEPPPVPSSSSTRPSLPPRQSSTPVSECSEKSVGGTPDTSTASTPRRELPPAPKRTAPPPLPPSSRGPPPALPSRPPSGPPPPVPRR